MKVKDRPNLAIVFDYLNHIRDRLDELHSSLQGSSEDFPTPALSHLMSCLSDVGGLVETIYTGVNKPRCSSCGMCQQDIEEVE